MHLEQGLEPKFGNTGPPCRRIDCRYSRLLRSSHAPWRHTGLMTCVRQTSVYEGSCRTRTKSTIRQCEPSRNGLAFRTRPTAPPHACAWDRDATASQNDPIRDERPRGRRWRGATSCAASSGGYSCARRISREKHVRIAQHDPFFGPTQVVEIDGGPKLKSGTPPPN